MRAGGAAPGAQRHGRQLREGVGELEACGIATRVACQSVSNTRTHTAATWRSAGHSLLPPSPAQGPDLQSAVRRCNGHTYLTAAALGGGVELAIDAGGLVSPQRAVFVLSKYS